MFDNVTLGQVYLTLLVIGALAIILLLFVAFKLDSLTKHIDKQRDMSELKNQIISEIRKGTNTKD